jgi:hypothetical protein
MVTVRPHGGALRRQTAAFEGEHKQPDGRKSESPHIALLGAGEDTRARKQIIDESIQVGK